MKNAHFPPPTLPPFPVAAQHLLGEQVKLNREQVKLRQDNNLMMGTMAEAVQEMNKMSTAIVTKQNAQAEEIVDLKKDVAELKDESKELRDGVKYALHTLKSSKLRQGKCEMYYPYVHLWFDGSTGNLCFCPVTLNDHRQLARKLVVLCVHAIFRFMNNETLFGESYSDTCTFLHYHFNDMKARNLNLDDQMNAYLQSSFKFLTRRPSTQAENSRRLIIVEFQQFKDFLSEVNAEYLNRPRRRQDINHRVSPALSHKSDGFEFGFDTSMAPINVLGAKHKNVSAKRRKQLPVIAEPWVKDWYTPLVGELFGVPADMLGVRHVVACEVASESECPAVKTYEEGLKDFLARKKRESDKKLARELKKKDKEANAKAVEKERNTRKRVRRS